jgi:hypothetical protein
LKNIRGRAGERGNRKILPPEPTSAGNEYRNDADVMVKSEMRLNGKDHAEFKRIGNPQGPLAGSPG